MQQTLCVFHTLSVARPLAHVCMYVGCCSACFCDCGHETMRVTGQVVLATNVAESSITIPDVTVVLDFCLCRAMEFNDARGMPALCLQHISRVRTKPRPRPKERLGTPTSSWVSACSRDLPICPTMVESFLFTCHLIVVLSNMILLF